MLMILFSCHEVEEQHLNFNQTIWNATKTWFDDNDRVVGSSTSVLEFLTESNTYSGRYPFSIPVIPVHFFVSKDRYLLRS